MATESLYKRPKRDDDEDELLRQQEEFLKVKQQPSAKIINSINSARENIGNGTRDSCSAMQDGSKTRSHFFNLKKLNSKSEAVSTSQSSGEMINPVVKEKIQERKLEDTIHNIPIEPSNIILGNIVEKKYHIKKYKFDDNRVSVTNETGFPKVFGSDNKVFMKRSYIWFFKYIFTIFMLIISYLVVL